MTKIKKESSLKPQPPTKSSQTKPKKSAAVRSVGRPSLEEARQLSATILAVAEKHFLAHGYLETNLNDIAREAKTTKNAIYSRFTDKATLFSKVCSQVIERHYLRDIEAEEDDLPLRESLGRRAMAILAAALQQEALDFYRIIGMTKLSHPEIQAITIPVWDFYVKQFSVYFKRRIDKGVLHIRRPELAATTFAQLILAPIHVAIVHGMEIPDMEQMRQHVDHVTLVFLGGFGRAELEAYPDELEFANE